MVSDSIKWALMGLSIISRSSVVLITFSLQKPWVPVTASFSSLPRNLSEQYRGHTHLLHDGSINELVREEGSAHMAYVL